jgi:hypothetical protein
MMITQSPMAVSIVAGRVRKWGVGTRARRSSLMANNSKYDFVQTVGFIGPKYWA